MCYYSLSMNPDMFRKVVVGEDLRVVDYQSHAVFRARDRMIVCIPRGVEVHIASLQLRSDVMKVAMTHGLPMGFRGRAIPPEVISDMIGKPVHGTFRSGDGDFIIFNDMRLHISYLKPFVDLYVGPERKVRLETRLGMDDPSIVHDHNVDFDRTPMLQRVFDRLCSVTR